MSEQLYKLPESRLEETLTNIFSTDPLLKMIPVENLIISWKNTFKPVESDYGETIYLVSQKTLTEFAPIALRDQIDRTLRGMLASGEVEMTVDETGEPAFFLPPEKEAM